MLLLDAADAVPDTPAQLRRAARHFERAVGLLGRPTAAAASFAGATGAGDEGGVADMLAGLGRAQMEAGDVLAGLESYRGAVEAGGFSGGLQWLCNAYAAGVFGLRERCWWAPLRPHYAFLVATLLPAQLAAATGGGGAFETGSVTPWEALVYPLPPAVVLNITVTYARFAAAAAAAVDESPGGAVGEPWAAGECGWTGEAAGPAGGGAAWKAGASWGGIRAGRAGAGAVVVGYLSSDYGAHTVCQVVPGHP